MNAGSAMPALSVVMPLHDKRAYVRAGVESVLAQRHDRFTLIVVDDGSTDDGLTELADIADPRIRVLRQPNAGVAAARNRGIAEAPDAWIALIDADDLWSPDHLGEIARLIAAAPDAGLVATRIRQTWSGSPPSGDDGPGTIRQVDYFEAAATDAQVVTSSSVALRRAAVEGVGGFRDLRPGEDIDCWARIALDWPVAVSDRLTAHYRRGTGGQMDVWRTPLTPRSRDIPTLAAFGGAVETLSAALAGGRYEERRRHIERFIDERILANAGKSLAMGDTRGAARRLRFVHDRARARYVGYRLLSLLPPSVLAAAIPATRGIRRRLR